MRDDPEPYANFIVRHLLKPLPLHPGATHGVAETEKPIEGDDWFWADDNAKVLELLGLPALWRNHQDDITRILTFLGTFCEGPLIFRRIARARMEEVVRGDGEYALLHGMMNVNATPSKGIVSLGMRFHDGRTARNVLLTGNYVQFTHRGRNHVLDVEQAITGHAVEHDGDCVHIRWHADLRLPAGMFSRHRGRLGRLTTTTTIRPDTMFVDVENELQLDPGVCVSDVVLTFGYDDVSTNDNNVRYEDLHFVRGTSSVERYEATNAGTTNVNAEGVVYWSISQRSHMRGFALGVHSLVVPQSPIHRIALHCQQRGQFHWVHSAHRFPGPHNGATLRASERKLITAGGFYDDALLYARVLQQHGLKIGQGCAPVDMSISYDYGAEAKAFARCFRTIASNTSSRQDCGLRDGLQVRMDILHEAYQNHFIKPSYQKANGIFSRSISFMTFAYADMLAATGEDRYRHALYEASRIVATFERENEDVAGFVQSGFLMGKEQDALPYPDCHSACLLALVRSTAILGTDEWLAAIDRGLAAYRIDTIKLSFLGWQKQDIVGIDYRLPDGSRRTLDMFWNFSAGITLRLFNALRASRHPGLSAIWARHAGRLDLMATLLHARVACSLRPRGDAIEILTSTLSAETNSETQPWVGLGLIDEAAAEEAG